MDMAPVEIHKKLMEMGVSDLDAGLVVNCINNKSSYTWMNTDPITKEQIGVVNAFLSDNGMGILVELSEVSYQGKFIWDVKVQRPLELRTEQAEAPAANNRYGPVGRFKTLSELGL